MTKRRKVLVTGGLGYIGSHTVVELLKTTKNPYEVVIVDNCSNAKPIIADKIKEIQDGPLRFIEADARDKGAMRQIMQEEGIEAIIHFAGYKAVGESVAQPLSYYRNNLDSTLTLLEVAQELGVDKFVFSSSATVYGHSKNVPYEETEARSSLNPYGRTKVMIEDILADLASAWSDFGVIALRYFNPLGAHESGDIGENPTGIPNNLAPYITQVAVGKLDELHIFGDDYPTPDGTCIRDYVHVMDLAEGHVLALDRLYEKEGLGFEAINLGSGQGYSVFEILHAFEEAVGRPIPHRVTARRPGDGPISVASNTKARDLLGWEPKRSLKMMCQDQWRWQEKHPEGY